MYKLRSFVAACALLAIVAAATAAPAMAAPGKGTIGIVNGKPGGRVDICINGHEIRSNAKYGGRKYRILNPGDKVIKIFKADRRKCRGHLLGKRTIPLAAGDDLTIVFTKRFPKFTVFANGFGDIPATPGDPYPVPYLYWRHAADLGNTSFKFQYRITNPETPVAPVADPVWTKGDEAVISSSVGWGWKLRATRPDMDRTIANSKWIDLEIGKRYEWILLGSRPKNAKFIVWVRDIVEPTP